jgi:hypothetical protein
MRAPDGVAVAEISLGDFAPGPAESACWVWPENHVTMAAMTSIGLKDRKNRRTVRSIVTNETPPSFAFVSPLSSRGAQTPRDLTLAQESSEPEGGWFDAPPARFAKR